MEADPADPLAGVVGQPEAVARLRAAVSTPVHAYLFLGPRGSGRHRAALAFAAALLARDVADRQEAERVVRLALTGRHPDVSVFEPEGRTWLVEDVGAVITEASRAAVEGDRKLLVCERFHTATPAAAAKLLKTFEEPSPSAVFVLIAEEVPPEHVTVASRCTQVDFRAVGRDVLVRHLEGLGVEPERAAQLAEVAGGSLDRAELLATDPAAMRRFEAWSSVPDRLDGTGAAVAVLVEELRSLIDDAQGPLVARHAEQELGFAEREAQGLLPTVGERKAMAARHKREVRLLRDDELRTGMAVLARRYRDLLVQDVDAERWAGAIDAIGRSAEALVRNPNEALLLQGLLLRLPPTR
jgi:DNA polymerase III subunit delta'